MSSKPYLNLTAFRIEQGKATTKSLINYLLIHCLTERMS